MRDAKLEHQVALNVTSDCMLQTRLQLSFLFYSLKNVSFKGSALPNFVDIYTCIWKGNEIARMEIDPLVSSP